ncbi:hypothetical protein Avbf_14894, partial [Armadillidium vulgare]
TQISFMSIFRMFQYFFLYLDHPGKCVSKDNRNKTLIMDIGESRLAPLGSCYRLDCVRHGPYSLYLQARRIYER